MGHLYHTSSPELRDSCGRSGREIVRVRGQEGQEWSCHLDVTGQATVVPTQDLSVPEWKGKSSCAPPLTEELWTPDGFWVFKAVTPGGWLCSSWWSRTQEYIGSTNWSWWVIKTNKKNTKLGHRDVGGILEELRGRIGVNIIKILCRKSSKN